MKIASLINTDPIYTELNDCINNYYAVPDTYDFSGNSAYDVTTVTTLYNFYQINVFDYNVLRDNYKNVYVPIWSACTFDDRQFMVSHYCYPPAISIDEWNTYYTEPEFFEFWTSITHKTRDEVRLPRLFAAFNLISYKLTQVQVLLIYETTKAICVDYYYGNTPHLMLWITNSSLPALGIDYTTSGFAQMSGYSTTLRDSLLDILVNGNY